MPPLSRKGGPATILKNCDEGKTHIPGTAGGVSPGERQLPPPPEPAPELELAPEVEPAPAPERELLLRPPEQAAADLYAYAREVLDAGKGHLLGVKGAPSETVRLAQQDMGELVDDGFYGPSVRARGRELLGKIFPIRRA